MKIAVYTIAKDEGPRIARAIASAKEADLFLVADTGSKDDTIQIARDGGAEVHLLSILPFRFDAARNAALALVPADFDVCIALDADEVLIDGWRKVVEAAFRKGATQLTYLFKWDGGANFVRDRIHARHGYYWHGFAHEGLRRDPRALHKPVHSKQILVMDLPPNGRCGSPEYLLQLWAWAKEFPAEHRPAFYYARELAYSGKYEKAIEEFERFLAMRSKWSTEREFAQRWIGRAFRILGKEAEAIAWGKIACQTRPDLRSPILWLAETYRSFGRWEECRLAVSAALSISSRAIEFTEEAQSWDASPLDLAAISSFNLGRPEDALLYAKKAFALAPSEERAKRLKQFGLGKGGGNDQSAQV